MSQIDRWIILFAGFTQQRGKPIGLAKLWRSVQERYSGARTVVHLATWREDVDDLAEWVWQWAPLPSRPRICTIGYSFGGQTAVNFASQLQRRGLEVDSLVLCDAVYRYRCPLGWWRSMMPFSRIRVPSNVHEVRWCRQSNPRFKAGRPGPFAQPAGHDIIARDPGATVIHDPQVLRCEHAWIDDSPGFQAMAWESVRSFCDRAREAA